MIRYKKIEFFRNLSFFQVDSSLHLRIKITFYKILYKNNNLKLRDIKLKKMKLLNKQYYFLPQRNNVK